VYKVVLYLIVKKLYMQRGRLEYEQIFFYWTLKLMS